MLADHILYMEDWRHKDTGKLKAYPDLDTVNTHFKVFCKKLEMMGIKNCLFPLALRDQGLKGVDPHSLNETTDPDFSLRGRVLKEASLNIWYFLRECVRFPAGAATAHMTFNRANCAMVWCFMQGINYTAIQPRQTGKTTLALLLSVWCMYVGCKSFGMGMYTRSDDLRKKNMEAFRVIRNLLPKYFVVKAKGGIDNTEMIRYSSLDNNYWTFLAQKSEVAANSVGRGFSLMCMHFDEPAFCTNLKASMASIGPAMSKASENAKLYGFPHSILYTTTAGDPSSESGRAAFQFVNGGFKMTETLYDFPNRETTKKFIKDNSTNGSVNGTYSHIQLGKTNQWLMDEINKYNYGYDTVLREYLNRWYIGTGTPILSQKNLKRISASRVYDGQYREIIDNFVITWYCSEEDAKTWRDKPFICGLDSSEMVDRDFTTAVAIDPKTMRTLFTFRCNNANITEIAAFFTTLMSTYNRMILVPEAKSTGRTIMDAIADNLYSKNISPFTRIFNRVVQEYNTNKTFRKMDFRDPALYTEGGRKYVGFMTTGKSRNELYKHTLQKAANLSADNVLDPTLIEELMSLELRNGRIDHSSEKHDDMVISWLLAHWLVFYGTNLRYYGLDVDEIETVSAEESVAAKIIKDELQLRTAYQHLKARMDRETNPFVKSAFKQRLYVLQSKMRDNVKLAPISQEVARKGGYELSNEKTDPLDGTETTSKLKLLEIALS